MTAKKTKSGILGKTESTILIVLVLIILVWAYKTCQSPVARDAPVEDLTEKTEENFPVVFISVDSLNMRSGPTLDSTIVAKLRLGEPILYLNERTTFRQKLNFNGTLQNVPWVKVRTRDGVNGWIYGAGARFYETD